MPDQSEVEDALVALIAAAVYPSGTGSPSVTGKPLTIFRGWPTPDQLQIDLAAGVTSISIATRNGVERSTTRYNREPDVVTPPVHTLTALVAGSQVTIGGTVTTPQNVVAVLGGKHIYPYGVQPADTLALIAAGLAALIAVDFPGTVASGPVITIAGRPGNVIARVVAAATMAIEVKRQEKSFQIGIWSPSPGDRDLTGKAVDPFLASLTFLSFPDGSKGRITYERTITFDNAQEEESWRRDLFYWVEYPTLVTQPAYEIGAIRVQISGGQGANPPVINETDF